MAAFTAFHNITKQCPMCITSKGSMVFYKKGRVYFRCCTCFELFSDNLHTYIDQLPEDFDDERTNIKQARSVSGAEGTVRGASSRPDAGGTP